MEILFTNFIAQTSFHQIFMIAGFIILGISIIVFLYQNYYSANDDADYKKRVAIKIDRDGNYRYQPHADNSNRYNSMFWKVIFIIIALALLFIPIEAYINRS